MTSTPVISHPSAESGDPLLRVDELLTHLGAIYGFVAMRVGRERSVAEDIVQEIFVAALREPSRIANAASTRAWLFQVARNKLSDHVRLRLRAALPLEHATDLLDVDAANGDRERQERAILVGRALDALTPEQVDLLVQKYICGVTVQAIADERRASEKSVESALGRARDAFRAAYRRLLSHEETRS